MGYADSTGNPAMTQNSVRVAPKAVIGYLIQQGGIPIPHIVAPGAWGETHAVGSNETWLGGRRRKLDDAIPADPIVS
jgi:hypothetical protein